MKRVLVFLALAACAPAVPVFKPVTVEVPVVSPCHTATVTPPDFALSHVAKTDDVYAKTRAALVELDQRKAYEAEMAAEIKGCE
ncbi:MAG: hypothetical protein P4M13_09615 [Alphaproteobacteria bacterium]|nr:hypothetical protein [Alphaproteobacteria bacterium]